MQYLLAQDILRLGASQLRRLKGYDLLLQSGDLLVLLVDLLYQFVVLVIRIPPILQDLDLLELGLVLLLEEVYLDSVW